MDGDGDTPVADQARGRTEGDHLRESVQDALSDDIVARLGAMAGDGADLLDRVTRSELHRALPAISRLVETGDLDRVVALARVMGSAGDAMSDDIVGRMGAMAGDSMVLLDKVNRSKLERVLPAMDRLVESGDLDRAVNGARLLGAAGDAMTDDIVARLGETASELMCIADRLSRSEGLFRLLDVLDRQDVVENLVNLSEAVAGARAEEDAEPERDTGGLGGIYRTVVDGDVQDALNFLARVHRHYRKASAAD